MREGACVPVRDHAVYDVENCCINLYGGEVEFSYVYTVETPLMDLS